ncbi:MAG: hypothetical protein MJ132_04970, partial [Clostridia bacterium]|nr:hypothetical protein [Clostridia bacterium]
IRASACNSAGVEEWTCNYTLGTFSDDTGRVANEISSDNAYLTVMIDGADSGTKSLKLFTRDGGEEPEQPEEPTDPVDDTVHALSEYVNFGGNNIVLNSTNKKLTSDTACGYNKTVRVDLQTVTGANGNLWVMIGSYGVRLRGGSFRIAYLNAYDRYDELTRVGETLNCPTQIFDDGTHYLLMRVDESAAGVTVHVQVCNVNGTVEVAHSYEIGSYQGSVMPDGGRIAGEISSENARLTIIADDSSLGTTSATVKPN